MTEADRLNVAHIADHVGLTAEIVAAYVANNNVPVAELPALLAGIHAALTGLGQGSKVEAPIEKLTPAQIRKSITHDALISFEDGRPYKTLKRHLSGSGLTPETYRTKWGLPKDYPMTAAGYSEARSKLAVGLGLGRKRTAETLSEPDADPAAEAPKRAGRPRNKGAAEA